MFHTEATRVPPRRVSTIDAERVFSRRLAQSTSLLILHGYRSADPTPDPQDVDLTRLLAATGQL